MNQTQSQFERNYHKAYIKLLTASVNVPKKVDEYFFGQADDRDEASEEIRPYFYGLMTFCIALVTFMHAIIK